MTIHPHHFFSLLLATALALSCGCDEEAGAASPTVSPGAATHSLAARDPSCSATTPVSCGSVVPLAGSSTCVRQSCSATCDAESAGVVVFDTQPGRLLISAGGGEGALYALESATAQRVRLRHVDGGVELTCEPTEPGAGLGLDRSSGRLVKGFRRGGGGFWLFLLLSLFIGPRYPGYGIGPCLPFGRGYGPGFGGPGYGPGFGGPGYGPGGPGYGPC